jgi:transposase
LSSPTARRFCGSAKGEAARAVVMDMNASYEEEIREHSPQADIVYDLFHVVAKYWREVIDRVRVDEQIAFVAFIKSYIFTHARHAQGD